MRISLNRQTGFYGSGSQMKVFIDGEAAGYLNAEVTKQFEIREQPFTVQVNMLLMKSRVYRFDTRNDGEIFVIKMNSKLIVGYLLFFMLALFLPALMKDYQMMFVLLGAYLVFLVFYLRQAFVIESADGSE